MIMKNVCAGYSGKTVIKNFSLEIHAGQKVMLVGKSGSGKTTVLNLLCGLMKPSSGEIVTVPRIGTVFQEDRLVEHVSCLKNCMIVGASEKAVREIFAELGIAEVAEMRPRNISGGQRRRVAIARALLFEADCYVLDEPFAGLDAAARENAISCVLRRTKNKMLILASHNHADADELNAEIIEI